MFATCAKVQEVLGLPVELLTEDIMRTKAYQEYVEEYGRSPKPKTVYQKLKEKIVGESSEPRKPIRIKVKHPQSDPISFVVHVTTSAEYELHPVNTTKDLIIHRIDDTIPTEQVELMNEEVEADIFVDDMVLSHSIPGTRLEPWHNKENLKEIVDNDDEMSDNDDHTDHTLIRNEKTGSLETRNEKMQTLIPTPPRSFRNDLSFDKETFV
ncbi:hypothetical protein Tco_1172617 [Tanacetum coccineum]